MFRNGDHQRNTKFKGGHHGCFGQVRKINIPRIGEDEPLFIPRAQDRLAQGVVEIYKILAASHGSPFSEQVEKEIDRFHHWSGAKKMLD